MPVCSTYYEMHVYVYDNTISSCIGDNTAAPHFLHWQESRSLIEVSTIKAWFLILMRLCKLRCTSSVASRNLFYSIRRSVKTPLSLLHLSNIDSVKKAHKLSSSQEHGLAVLYGSIIHACAGRNDVKGLLAKTDSGSYAGLIRCILCGV